jgi:hypothetical protein
MFCTLLFDACIQAAVANPGLRTGYRGASRLVIRRNGYIGASWLEDRRTGRLGEASPLRYSMYEKLQLLVPGDVVVRSWLVRRREGMEEGLLGASSRFPRDSHHLPLSSLLQVLIMVGISIKAGMFMMVLAIEPVRSEAQFMIRVCLLFDSNL